jgi:hypothetical protein
MVTTEALLAHASKFDRICSLRPPYGAHGPVEAKLAKMTVLTRERRKIGRSLSALQG